MMKIRVRGILAGTIAAALLIATVTLAVRSSSVASVPETWTAVDRLPHVRPDYAGIVIPPNIAPLNFAVEEPGVEYRVRIYGKRGGEIVISSRSPAIEIPIGPWRELLQQNRGGVISVAAYARSRDGQWSGFKPIDNEVAREEIDSHLAYRLLGPLYNLYRNVGIYQRNLETYDESPILTNDSFDNGCVNCHTFVNNSPDTFFVHVRPGPTTSYESGMITVRQGRAVRVKTQNKAVPKPPGYSSWHPSGRVAAFSTNKPGLLMHGAGAEVRDVYDFNSDLGIMNFKAGAASTSPGIAAPDMLETFPAWSHDGKSLYFCSAKRLWSDTNPPAIQDFWKIRYDLMRVRYDIDRDAWGSVETILSSADTGMSISLPKASPDGKYLVFCMSAYGAFPVYQKSSDLYLMDLKTGTYRRMECNSDRSESWHCWSSNSRWLVFSSKRDNGWLARPYFSYVDAEGVAHKPFILPQKNPGFYDSYLKNYNLPELVRGPVTVTQKELARAILSSTEDAKTGATPRVESSAPSGERPYERE